jgi:Terminase small subunit
MSKFHNKQARVNELLYGAPTTKPVTFADHLVQLSQRNAIFVRNIVSGKTAIESYMAIAGTTRNRESAAVQATRLLKRPEIAEAIQQGRKEAAADAQYELKDLVEELNSVANFAKETKNATAYARAVELKAKALGLLIDRQDIRVNQTVDLTGLLLEATNRVKLIDAQVVNDAPLLKAPE